MATRGNAWVWSIAAAMALGGLAWLGAAEVSAQHMHGHAPVAKGCEQAVLACATKATPFVAGDGTVWLAFTAGGRVLVARSADGGQTFGAPVAVNGSTEALDWGPDARPQIVVDGGGRVTVAYAIFKDKAFNGEVRIARSGDAGRSFSAPVAITGDPESQRFAALGLDASGRVFAAWLDKRNRAQARTRGEKYPGAALAFAWLDGRAGAPARIELARDGTCECCRLGVGFAGPGRPVVVFRNIFSGSIRDHAVITFVDAATPGEVRRVSVDDWKTDACPHQGPALSIGPDGAYHVVWFTDGQARHGLFYAVSRDEGRTFSAPEAVGDEAHAPQRPALLVAGETLYLAWKEFDGTRTALMVKSRPAGGLGAWTPPRAIATAARDSDQPLLVAREGRVFVSWLTAAEGYRLIAIEAVL